MYEVNYYKKMKHGLWKGDNSDKIDILEIGYGGKWRVGIGVKF